MTNQPPYSRLELKIADAMQYPRFCNTACPLIERPLAAGVISPEQASIMRDMRIDGFRAAIQCIANNPTIRQAVYQTLDNDKLLTHINDIIKDIVTQNKPEYNHIIASMDIITMLAFIKYKEHIKSQPESNKADNQQTNGLINCIMQVLDENSPENLLSGFDILKATCNKIGWQIAVDEDSNSYTLVYEVNPNVKAIFKINCVPIAAINLALKDALSKFDINTFAKRAYQESHGQLAMDDSLDEATQIKIKLAELIAEITVNTNAQKL